MLDLTTALYHARSRSRGDEAGAHIADLYACLRQTWYRRNGYPGEIFTREKLAQFAIGLGYERAVADSLAECGLVVRQNVEVEYLGLIGHPDIIAAEVTPEGRTKWEVLIEVKTTELRTPKPEVSPHYAIQAAAYALALGIPKAIVLVKHAGSHVETEYHIDPEGYRRIIEKRAAEVVAQTAKGAPIPPADPGELAAWGCKYCSYVQCPSNPKYVAPVGVGAETPF
jgi:CRISPR/Cas system-associated exonuclease Cas4 (RecB family)